MEATTKVQNLMGTNTDSKLLLLTDTPYPRIELTFNEPDTFRGPMEIDAEEFIAVKGFKAKGKRLTLFSLNEVTELEPTRFPDPDVDEEDVDETESEDVDDSDDTGGTDGSDGGADSASGINEELENEDSRVKSDDEIRDELTGQLRLF